MRKILVLLIALTISNLALANDPPPPNLEDAGNSFINNAGDNSQDLTPDGNAPEMVDISDESNEAPPEEVAEPVKPQKPRASRPAASPVAKKGPCDIRIFLKCDGQPVKNRQVQLQMDGVGYPKNTTDGGELVQSFQCPQGAKGKKFLMRFVEFKTEISMDKVPYSIDIPKRQCL